MNRTLPASKRLALPLLFSFFFLVLWFVILNRPAETAEPSAQSGGQHIGYGFNVAPWDVALLQSMGFDWMKVFNPPGARLPTNILIRVEAQAQDMANLPAFRQQVKQLAQGNGPYIEAYEIGNEPNLDANYGWNAPPIAADYAVLLCAAYEEIKQADPTAIVVSAGIAPVGRVQGTWQGHAGHNGLYQDERQYLLEFLASGGADCFDVLGYHPYGFVADFDAPPDVPSTDPNKNCVNGFCFRGVEKIYEIMQANGYGDRSIWATEYGWIVAPPNECLSEPDWQGRAWQIVSEQKQASNLVGTFTYAEANYPWMGAMFVFNLNFNAPGWYPLCEQMRYYAVDGRLAETALSDMPKNPVPTNPVMTAAPTSLRRFVDVDDMPTTTSASFSLGNEGWQPMPYSLSVAASNGLTLTFPQPTGLVGYLQQVPIQITVEISQPLGVYSAEVRVDSMPGTSGAPVFILVEVEVIPEVYKQDLPAVFKN